MEASATSQTAAWLRAEPARDLPPGTGYRAVRPLLVLGLACAAVLVAAVTWLERTGFDVLPFHSLALSPGAAGTTTVTTKVLKLEPTPLGWDRTLRVVQYGIPGSAPGLGVVRAEYGLAVGDPVVIRFLRDEPARSVLVDPEPAGPGLLVHAILIGLGIGVLGLLIALRAALAQRSLLRDGRLTSARVAGVRRGSNLIRQAQLDLEWVAADGGALKGVAAWPSKLGTAPEVGAFVPIMHDPLHPTRLCLLLGEEYR